LPYDEAWQRGSEDHGKSWAQEIADGGMEKESAGEDEKEKEEIEEKKEEEQEEASEEDGGRTPPEDEYYDEALALTSDDEFPPGAGLIVSMLDTRKRYDFENSTLNSSSYKRKTTANIVRY